jgi:prepilin-type N-terminal cleavage/methylation domain-containing protein
MKLLNREEGFTLVELLIVMAIMAVLIGLSVAGLRYATIRSRNIARASAMSNLDTALQAYYSDQNKYPASTETVLTLTSVPGTLKSFLEGSFDGGANGSKYIYKSNSATNATFYTICVNQEKTVGNQCDWICAGPGIGQPGGYPPTKKIVGQTCAACAVCGTPVCTWQDGAMSCK